MPEVKAFYTCQACGFRSLKWLGKCPDCYFLTPLYFPLYVPVGCDGGTRELFQNQRYVPPRSNDLQDKIDRTDIIR